VADPVEPVTGSAPVNVPAPVVEPLHLRFARMVVAMHWRAQELRPPDGQYGKSNAWDLSRAELLGALKAARSLGLVTSPFQLEMALLDAITAAGERPVFGPTNREPRRAYDRDLARAVCIRAGWGTPTSVDPKEPFASIALPDGVLRVWERQTHEDLGRMYVLDVMGIDLLIRERPDGMYVHLDWDADSTPAGHRDLLIEVDNGGETFYPIQDR
jgi:hypothetical protein